MGKKNTRTLFRWVEKEHAQSFWLLSKRLWPWTGETMPMTALLAYKHSNNINTINATLHPIGALLSNGLGHQPRKNWTPNDLKPETSIKNCTRSNLIRLAFEGWRFCCGGSSTFPVCVSREVLRDGREGQKRLQKLSGIDVQQTSDVVFAGRCSVCRRWMRACR